MAFAGVDAFQLVPRHRLRGLELGPLRSARRGPGSDTAGSRPYHPRDDVRAIDWAASAKLSAALGSDEFVVRERYADQAPRVVALADRRPAMALYGEPWLSKRRAVEEAARLIAASALRSRGLAGSLDHGDGETDWRPPAGRPEPPPERSFAAPPDTVARGLGELARTRALPPGSFVFVLSDFLPPPPEEVWLEALARRWDVVPVVIRDPLWETDFPEAVGGLVLPLLDPATGELRPVRLTTREARLRAEANRTRLAELERAFSDLGLDWIVLRSHEPDAVLGAFLEWAAGRLAPAGRAW